MNLGGFDSFQFSHGGETRLVFQRGEGPGVLVMHEVPGITPPVADFARRVADEGFTVMMPQLFGVPGKPLGVGNSLSALARACIVREFAVLASDRSSPITAWLRALARHLHEHAGGPGVGAVGMCLTGNFALALTLDAPVQAPVLSQPSLPFVLGRKRSAAVHASEAELDEIVRRHRDDGLTVLGLRFTHDFMCPKARFDALRQRLGDAFEAIEIDSGPRNPHGIKRTAHSVLTNDLVDEDGHPTAAALRRVLALFDERLRAGTQADDRG